MKTLKEINETLDVVAVDIEADVSWLEGREFNGKNVATMFGRQAACILACVKTLQRLVDEVEELKNVK